ncbi:MAG TPA: outer membrane protein assembly factor BamE [Thiobacillaceae bacterium]|nr:outer membrane protein assembly factor BamE [Thiobacillaceae bacterium]HNU62940.1 outer membrane protein assembly factor BamE [Thiobacillaceae bacterium]
MRSVLLLIPLLLTGCGSWSHPIDKLGPYKIDVQQGNVISQEMLGQLKPGMTPAQVRFILGSPLVQDPFHPNRWDYVYRYQKAGRLTEQRRVIAVFEDGLLKAVEGDVVAAGQGSAAQTGTEGNTP